METPSAGPTVSPPRTATPTGLIGRRRLRDTERFAGRTAVVTGAAAGIGRAIAGELARAGARLALSDVDSDGLARTVEGCRRLGAEARGYPLDVGDRAAVLGHAEQVAGDFGGVHLVVNNAGVAVFGSVTGTSWETFDWINRINIDGVLNGTKAFLPLLIASGEGHLVNMSSMFGLISPPLVAAYSAGKCYVRGLTQSVRQEMRREGHPVGVTAVHPGFVRTDLVRSGRIAPDHDPARITRTIDTLVLTTPRRVARKVLDGVRRDRARVLVGPDAYLGAALARVAGSGYQRLTVHLPKVLGE